MFEKFSKSALLNFFTSRLDATKAIATPGLKALDAQVGKELNESIQAIMGDMATIETSSVVAHSYAIGDYLIYNGVLYKVTVGMSAGNSTIIPGTNCTATTAGAELSSLTGSYVYQYADLVEQVTKGMLRTDTPSDLQWSELLTYFDNVCSAGRIAYFRMRTSYPTSSWNYCPGLVLRPSGEVTAVILFGIRTGQIAMLGKYSNIWDSAWKYITLS